MNEDERNLVMTRIEEIFTCPQCGRQDRMHFDASFLMERAFEGVFFDVLRESNNAGFVVRPQPKDEDYLEDFNMEKHLAEARQMLLEDAKLTFVYCPKCEDSLA